jgi:hypothetical protein
VGVGELDIGRDTGTFELLENTPERLVSENMVPSPDLYLEMTVRLDVVRDGFVPDTHRFAAMFDRLPLKISLGLKLVRISESRRSLQGDQRGSRAYRPLRGARE